MLTVNYYININIHYLTLPNLEIIYLYFKTYYTGLIKNPMKDETYKKINFKMQQTFVL